MVYTEAARGQYHTGNTSYSCSSCRRANISCSHQRDATVAAAATTPRKRKTKAALVTENDKLEAENDELRENLARQKRHMKWLLDRLEEQCAEE